MFNFGRDSLKLLLNKKLFRNGIGAYSSMRFLLLPLITIVSLLLGVALINAQNVDRLFVSSFGSNQVLEYNGSTGSFIEVFVQGKSEGLSNPSFLVFGPDGDLYVGSRGTHEVLRYNGETGEFIDAFVTARSGGLDDPWGLVFGPDGDLSVISRGTNEVLRYNGKTGEFIDAFVTARSGGLDFPSSLVFSSERAPIFGGGGGCSVVKAGSPVSLPMFLLVPVLVVILRRLARAKAGEKRTS